MRLSVLLPCFNELEVLPRFETELFPRVDALGVSSEIVAVDDGSSDGTGAALSALALKRPGLKIVAHKRNRGLGAALRSGFAAAKGDWIATLDADLTFSPAQVADLLATQTRTGADLVGGSPYLSADGMTRVPWLRRLPSILVNAFYRGLFDPGFTAYTPMFRLYRAQALRGLSLESDGFEINAELAARFIQKGLKVAECPVTLSTRLQGASKLDRWRELRAHARLVARLLRRPLSPD